jgi:hypothetical protein
MAARAAVASKVALARKRRADYPTNQGSAICEAAVSGRILAGGEVLRPTLEAVGGGFRHTEAWRSRTTADTTWTVEKEAGFVFSMGYEISGGINREIQTEF